MIDETFEFLLTFGRSASLGQRPMKSLWFVCSLFVRPSVRLSLSFLKIESLVFFDIVHDDSWPRYLMTNEARIGGPNLDQMAPWCSGYHYCTTSFN